MENWPLLTFEKLQTPNSWEYLLELNNESIIKIVADLFSINQLIVSALALIYSKTDMDVIVFIIHRESASAGMFTHVQLASVQIAYGWMGKLFGKPFLAMQTRKV